MRCAIRRLTSLGVSPAEPRMARDSVETHAMTSRRAWDQPPPQASKTSGRKEAPTAETWVAVFWKEFLRDSNLVKNVSHRRDSGGETGGTEDGGDRKVPGLSEARDSTGDPNVSRAAAGRSERGLIGDGARTGASRVRGLGREQEARFFELW